MWLVFWGLHVLQNQDHLNPNPNQNLNLGSSLNKAEGEFPLAVAPLEFLDQNWKFEMAGIALGDVREIPNFHSL